MGTPESNANSNVHPEWVTVDGQIIDPRAPAGGGGPGSFSTAGPLGPSPFHGASSIPHPQAPAVQTVDPIHVQRARRLRTKLAVVAFGWPGGEHRTTGFMLSAKTKQKELGKAVSLFAIPTKKTFAGVLSELSAESEVTEFHYFSHSGVVDGPIFQDGAQFTAAEVQALPKLHWAPGAEAFFYGCNSGYGWFAPAFATRQNVNVSGAAGFTMFSQARDKFYPFSSDPDSLPCYQGCFPGYLEIIRQKYGLVQPRNFIEGALWTLLTYEDVMEARDKHYPPKPMVRVKPGGQQQFPDYPGAQEPPRVF